MNMPAEDFTFPVISCTSNAALNLALLPPLWRISDDADSYKATTATRPRRTLASQVFKIDGEGAQIEEGSQEKMDLLWENFNEELLSSAASSDSDSDCSGDIIQHRKSDVEFGNIEVYANVRQLKLIPAKAKKRESLVKVLKKLFSLQNSNTARSNITRN